MRRVAATIVMVGALASPRLAAAQESPQALVNSGLAVRSSDRVLARSRFEQAARGDEALPAAEALYQLADLDEEGLDLSSALEHYRASLARAPQSRYAGRAETRIDYLRRHDEGGFAPLVRLEKVRRDEHFADSAKIDSLARDADAFPPGRVRVEAWLVVGDAYQRRLARPDDALAAYRKILGDPAADPLARQQAAHDSVDLQTAREDWSGALASASAVEDYDAALVARVKRLARRARLHLAADAELAVTALFAALTILLGLRKARNASAAVGSFARVALAFSLYVAIAGGVLASSYEGGSVRPFLALGGAVFGVALLARVWAAFSPSSTPLRLARIVLCGLAVAAAAFLLLEHIDPAYLDSFGL